MVPENDQKDQPVNGSEYGSGFNNNTETPPSDSPASVSEQNFAAAAREDTAPQSPDSDFQARNFEPIAHPAPVLGGPAAPTIQANTVATTVPQTPQGQTWEKPYSPNQTVFGDKPSFSPAGPGKPAGKRKRLLVLSVAVLAVILLAAGYVFGFYIPNKPENVWKTGLNRTGKALTQVVNDATEKDKLDSFKKTQINASIDVKAFQTDFTGTLDAEFDQNKLNFSTSYSSNLGSDKEEKLAADILSEIPEGEKYPNSYFRLIGLKALGADAFLPSISDYDGKWISVDSTYLKQLLGEETPTKTAPGPSAAEISEAIRLATAVTSDYVFTSQPDKAVLKLNQFVGKEDSEGLKAYHYKAGIDKEHTKAYCQELIQKLAATDAVKHTPGYDEKTAQSDIDAAVKDCKESIDKDYKVSDTIDVWFDSKYKLLHKVRVEGDEPDQYAEFGQIYKGGDDLHFFMNFHDSSDKSDAKATFDTNTKTSISQLHFDLSGGEGDDSYKVTINLDAKPLTSDITIKKPSDAIPLKDVLKKFGFDSDASPGSDDGIIQTKSKDAERQTDINAIHAQVEAYYAQNGYYPTQANLNDTTWVKANLIGLDQEALKDPEGTAMLFGSTATATNYGYRVSPTGCDNRRTECTHYTLGAKLSTGEVYKKTSLN